MTKIQCAQCDSFSLQKAGGMARQGFGVCLHDPVQGAYYSASYERDCAQFTPAEKNLTDARVRWLKKQREK